MDRGNVERRLVMKIMRIAKEGGMGKPNPSTVRDVCMTFLQHQKGLIGGIHTDRRDRTIPEIINL